jgi:hypothetical protein
VPPPSQRPNVVTFGDEVRGAPEVKIRERLAEPHHKVPHIFTTPARCVQRILKENIGCSELVDDPGIPRIAPESLEPAADNCFVILFA